MGNTNTCYDNGVKLITVGQITRVNTAAGALCYTVETMGGFGGGGRMQTYSFRDKTDMMVATGTAMNGQVAVTCPGQAPQNVPMNCLNLAPGGGRPGGGGANACTQGVCN